MRVWKFAAVTVGAVIVLLVALQLTGVTGRMIAPVLKARIEAATGYKLTKIDNVGLSLWRGLTVSAQDIALDKDDDPGGLNRLTIERIEAALPLSGLWSGGTEVSEVVITRPVLYQPLLRRRLPDRPARPGTGAKREDKGGRIDQIRIVGGEIAFARQRSHVDSRFGSINAVAMIGEKSLIVNGTALNAEHRMTYEFKSEGARDQAEIPLEFVMQIPDLSASPLQGRTDFSVSGASMSFAKVEAKLGDSAFSGKASVDLSNKPMVVLDLDLERLAVPVNPIAGDASPAQVWSTEPFNTDWLNYVDADLRFAAGEVRLGTMDLVAHAVKARLENGVMKVNLAEAKAQTPQAGAASGSRPAADKGRVNATITVDVNGDKQKLAIQSTFRDIPARPLLEAAVGFDRLEGRLQASIAVESQGNSQQAVMSNLQGVVSLDFRDGAVRGINVAQLIRSLTSDSHADGQESGGQKTDLSQLSASFSIDKGRASTSDIKLVGPMVRVTGAGTVDLGTRQMELRVEPTLVLTLEGQGRGSEPGGFGVPLTISGPWSALQIHPEIPGMLDNPEAFDALEQFGSGLLGQFFGGTGGGANGGKGSGADKDRPSGQGGGSFGGGGSGDGIGSLLGDLIQQGLSDGNGSRGGQRRPRP